MLAMIALPVGLPLGEVAPAPSLFTHRSTLHGQSHVSRVMVHAFRLIAATGWTAEAPRLWAAVYLHDIARTHDGLCYRHGGDAMKKFVADPSTHFVRSGQVVTCPSCGKRIPLTRALRAEIETSLKEEFRERERELRDEYERKLDADRERVEKDAAKRAEKKLAQELTGLTSRTR